MVLVTGGTGLVGSHLLYELALKNTSVRAIYRNEDTLSKVKKVFSYYSNKHEALFNSIEWFKTDLNNIPELSDAFNGITHVYHCAALISFNPKDFDKLKKANIEGTANIVNLCIANNIEKLCYVSSIATLGSKLNSTTITEDNHWNDEDINSAYAITKYSAELEVWRGTQEGLNAVIVNPGVILGPGFWNSGSGLIFTKIYNGLKFTTNGSVGFVDVYDVVKLLQDLMHSLLSEKRYILISENKTYKASFTTIAKALIVKAPSKTVAKWTLNVFWRLDWLKSMITGQNRSLTKALSKSLINTNIYDNTAVKTALNFEFTPFDVSIEKIASEFIKEQQSI